MAGFRFLVSMTYAFSHQHFSAPCLIPARDIIAIIIADARVGQAPSCRRRQLAERNRRARVYECQKCRGNFRGKQKHSSEVLELTIIGYIRIFFAGSPYAMINTPSIEIEMTTISREL